MSVEITETKVGSKLYEAELALRDEVLRKPLGRALSATDSARDIEGHHFVALTGGEVVACIGLYPQGEGVGRLRQMAVAPNLQRQGIGSKLLDFVEVWARERGFAMLTLHARLSALEFYERHGYVAEGEVFEEITIPHRRMRKDL